MSHAKTIVVGIVALITALMGAFGGFLTEFAPPKDEGSSAVWIAVGLASFFTLAGFLIAMAVVARFGTNGQPIIWLILTLMFVTTCVPGLVWYVKDQTYIASYPPRSPSSFRYVKGTELREASRTLRDELKEAASDDYLMWRFQGRPDKVWTAESVAAVRRQLTYHYLLFVVSLMLVIMCATQAAATITQTQQTSDAMQTR